MLEQGLQIFGALLILAGFLLSQLRLLEPRSWSYLWLNFAGAALLAVLALRGGQWGFLLLEGAWALVALGGLLVRARQRLSSSPPSP